MDNPLMPQFTRTLRLKVKPEAYAWLNAAAIETNQVWNWANEVSMSAADRNKRSLPKWLSGFDLNNLSAGATEYFDRIGADSIQRINGEYARKRKQFKRFKLKWRTSFGSRRSLGWIPFKAASVKRKGNALRFAGKVFRVFERELLNDAKWQAGCFAQDAVGDWFICLPVQIESEETVAPSEAVGIDLGLKTIATTSDGETLEAGRWTHASAEKLATAQRYGSKDRVRRIHRKIKRQRQDALHKFSRKIVGKYQYIVVGDVSSTKLVKTRMAKSVYDSGWSTLKNMLDYKSQQAARTFSVVNESYTSVTCSSCGSLTGPRGVNGLIVRSWICSECGDSHDRDVNAAKNILIGSRCRPPCAETSLKPKRVASSRAPRPRETGKRPAEVAA